MVQSSLATKSQSFELVKEEIENTIGQAELSLERFQENRESESDLQNCVDFLHQLRGIFSLVELRGGVMLCQESASLSNQVPVGATDDKNQLLTALSNALFTLRRYTEYYQKQGADHPELLLPVINEVREARGDKPYPDSCFFELGNASAPDFCAGIDLPFIETGNEQDLEIHTRRFRLMYQVGLLGLLNGQDLSTSRRLIARAATGLARLCRGEPLGSLWCLVYLVAEVMQEKEMGAEKNRKRLFMKIERYARELVHVGQVAMGKTSPDSITRELVYILYRSGSQRPEVATLLSAYGLSPAEFTEQQLMEHRRHLYGPGADVLKSLSQAVLEELTDLKDRLDIVERGIDPDTTELSNIATALERVGNSLLILDLTQLSTLARQEGARLREWEEKGTLPTESELYSVADAVLNIEEAAHQLAAHGITNETDQLANKVRRNDQSVYVHEALIVLADEASQALTLAKQAITAFLESDYDKLHLANVPATLRSIGGGLKLLEDEAAAGVMSRVTDCIEQYLLNTSRPPETRILEALADALTSLEYYIEGMGLQEKPNPELLRLAETSLTDVGL